MSSQRTSEFTATIGKSWFRRCPLGRKGIRERRTLLSLPPRFRGDSFRPRSTNTLVFADLVTRWELTEPRTLEDWSAGDDTNPAFSNTPTRTQLTALGFEISSIPGKSEAVR